MPASGKSNLHHHVEFVETQSEIDVICSEIVRAGRFAFDTEFVMEDRYKAELCLIQIALPERIALIDPARNFDTGPIWELVASASVETIVHAGTEDLNLVFQRHGEVPQNIFDVQIAAGFVGHDYPLSLQKLARAVLGVRLHKSKTLTDWRRRPLTAEQVRYAAEDVAYLLRIHEVISSQLTKRNRTQWCMEELNRFAERCYYERTDAEVALRVRGAGSLSGDARAIASELSLWREKAAARLDRPVRAVLKDHLLVEIARHGLGTVQEICSLRGINLARREVRGLCDVVRETKKNIHALTPPLSNSRRPETPRESVLVSLLTAVSRSYCMEQDIAYSLAANKRLLQELVRYRPAGGDEEAENLPDILAGWRGRSLGPALVRVLKGDSAVRCTDRNGAPLRIFDPQ